MAKFIKIKTVNNKYHLVRRKDIIRAKGVYEKEGNIKSEIYLRDDTILYCTIDEHEILEILNQ